MRRRIRWTLAGAGLVLLLGGGASIFWRPAQEILFSPDPPLRSCAATGCVALYRLEVGNTGRAPQEEVRIRLRSDALAGAVLGPRARDFGKLDRPVRVSEADGVRTIALGRLEPEARVDVSFVLRGPATQPPLPWERILVGVEGAGRVRRGSPGWVMLLRVWYAVFSAW